MPILTLKDVLDIINSVRQEKLKFYFLVMEVELEPMRSWKSRYLQGFLFLCIGSDEQQKIDKFSGVDSFSWIPDGYTYIADFVWTRGHVCCLKYHQTTSGLLSAVSTLQFWSILLTLFFGFFFKKKSVIPFRYCSITNNNNLLLQNSAAMGGLRS